MVAEKKVGKASLMLISMYFDIHSPIDIYSLKMQEILTHAKGAGTIFAIDINARSTSWHDVLTNKRGRALEEFLMIRQLYTANEESCYKTFQSRRRASNIDLTILNNQAIEIISDWTIHDHESCSDHNIIKYELGKGKEFFRHTGTNMTRTRYRVTQRDTGKFLERFIHIMEQQLTGINTVQAGIEKLDDALCKRIQSPLNIEERVEEFHEALDKACKSSFQQIRPTNTNKKTVQQKSVPWWTQNLTILRKKVNAHRRRYQRTNWTTATIPDNQVRVR